MEFMINDKEYMNETKYIKEYIYSENRLNYKLDNKFIRMLYEYIDEGYNYVVNMILCKILLLKKSKIKFQEDGLYIKRKINNKIKSKIKNQIKFTCKLLDREINIYIGIEEEKVDYKYYYLIVNYMLSILYILIKESNPKCSKKLDIFIYLTNINKNLPINSNETIGKYHVNSGYSFLCKKNNIIVIYRKEEWFKVFIHECLHAFGFHIIYNLPNNEIVNNLFNINNNINICLSECYVETWARILNVANISYLKTNSYDNFKISLCKMLEIETIYSCIQVYKILKYMDLTYMELINNNNIQTKYKENSNIFSYYILTTIFLLNINDFLKWCENNNKQQILKLSNRSRKLSNSYRKLSNRSRKLSNRSRKLSNRKIKYLNKRMTSTLKKSNSSKLKSKSLVDFIKDKYKNQNLIKILSDNNLDNKINNGLRMTIIELIK